MLDKVTFLHHMSNDFTESITMDDCVNLKFDTNLYQAKSLILDSLKINHRHFPITQELVSITNRYIEG